VLELAVAGGEDYELLAALPQTAFERARAEVETTGTTLTAIGRIAAGEGLLFSGPDGPVTVPSAFDQRRRSAEPADSA
jgi:thiamine-monophosphate kinase